jgi:hypothetical protein
MDSMIISQQREKAEMSVRNESIPLGPLMVISSELCTQLSVLGLH